MTNKSIDSRTDEQFESDLSVYLLIYGENQATQAMVTYQRKLRERNLTIIDPSITTFEDKIREHIKEQGIELEDHIEEIVLVIKAEYANDLDSSFWQTNVKHEEPATLAVALLATNRIILDWSNEGVKEADQNNKDSEATE